VSKMTLLYDVHDMTIDACADTMTDRVAMMLTYIAQAGLRYLIIVSRL
jgi:hypothetical protein